jgi:diguanylate cyclase (GGDEF)-like protein/PAS domain S-box-containing protein
MAGRSTEAVTRVGGVACAAALAAGVLGGDLMSDIANCAVITVAALGVGWGIRANRPTDRLPWVLLMATCTFSALAGAVTVYQQAGGGQVPYPAPGDAFYLTGYALAVAAGVAFVRHRSRNSDPTSLLDAGIVTGGVAALAWAYILVPDITDAHVSLLGKGANVGYDLLSLGLVAVVVRLALGPGARNRSWYWLAAAVASAMVSDLTLAEWSRYGQGGTVVATCNALAAWSCVNVAFAAVNPAMAQLTAKVKEEVPPMTAGRLAMMVGSALVAPGILLSRLGAASMAFTVGMVAIWAALGALIVVRMAILIRARERVASAEAIIRRAGSAMVSATSSEHVYRSATDAATQLLAVAGSSGRVRFAPAAGAGDGGSPVAAAVRAATALAEVSGTDPPAVAPCSVAALEPDGDEHSYVFPLVSSQESRGALVIGADRHLPQVILTGCETLARLTALALESASANALRHQQAAERRFRMLFEHSADLVIGVGEGDHLGFVSPSAAHLIGIDPAEATLSKLGELVHPEDRTALAELIARTVADETAPLEIRVGAPGGGWRWFEVVARDLTEVPEVASVVLTARNITDRKLAEAELRHQALHDDLTGLPNRLLLQDRVEQALRRRSPHDLLLAVLFIDLDDFKTVNDSLGHAAGDALLRQAGDRLRAWCRAEDTAGRLGGDEFAVLIESAATTAEVLAVCERLRAALQAPFEVGRRSLRVAASIGVAITDRSEPVTPDDLLRDADAAMYVAKGRGKDRIEVFEPSIHLRAVDRLELKGDLVGAAARGELRLHYQPLIELATGRTSSYEALLRWEHPTRGTLSPLSFIPLAEESGMISALGWWALEAGVRQLAAWREVGREVGVAVNLSARQLEVMEFVTDLTGLLRSVRIDPSWLTLELTETVPLDAHGALVLEAVRALGVGVAADDFGAGTASYASLQQAPYSAVKVDKSLTEGVGVTERADAQLRSIIQMAHDSGLTVVAEGVESATQAAQLIAMGCDHAQGYLFGHPRPPEMLTEIALSDLLRPPPKG